MRTALLVAFLLAMTGHSSLAADTVRLHTAGSLKAALTELAHAFTAHHGTPVETVFGASGLLRQRIEGGEATDLFASANLEHPRALAAAGRGSAVVLFARNQLCALAQPDLAIGTATMLDVLSDPDVILGTSTPKADPSGDYAWRLFRRAEAIRPGSYDLLAAKARQLTGGPDSPKAPDGRNTYGWVMAQRKADVFLTYCTNAVTAAAEVEGLQVVPLPESLAVGADYGLIVLNEGSPIAMDKRFFDSVRFDPLWQAVDAVKNGRVFLAPSLPFGWVDRPPSINRLIGIEWLSHLFYPEVFKSDLAATTRAFYSLFYQVDLSDAQIEMLLTDAGLARP